MLDILYYFYCTLFSTFIKMKLKILLLFPFCFSTLIFAQKNTTLLEINKLINNWHKNAAEVHFEAYMNFLAEDAHYLGTDATENWTKKEFQTFAKPYFIKGKTWNFNALKRNIYFSVDKKTVWFDELLDTQMKICRGSGVLVKTGKDWKLKQYVLSMTIPNDKTKLVVQIKDTLESKLIRSYKQ